MGLFYGRPDSPCKDCKERRTGCHPECEKYKTFAEENRRVTVKIANRRLKNNVYWNGEWWERA